MNQMIPAAKRILIGAVAVGALSFGTAGAAGAASSPTVPAVGSHFNCANATKVLTRIEKGEARIAAGLPKLTAAQAKAQQAGNTRRADRLKKRIDRFESAAFKARLAKASAAIEAKCHVSAPATTSGSGGGSSAQA
jgi:hypothetical protein